MYISMFVCMYLCGERLVACLGGRNGGKRKAERNGKKEKEFFF